jgi:hypothetical protein
MHILNPANSLLTLSILGVLAGAIMTSPLRVERVTHGNGNLAEATQDLAAIQTGDQGHYASAWQRLKCKTEDQIRDNDKRICKFKALRGARTSRTFSAIYDERVAELERRNLALKGKLNDYKGLR